MTVSTSGIAGSLRPFCCSFTSPFLEELLVWVKFLCTWFWSRLQNKLNLISYFDTSVHPWSNFQLVIFQPVWIVAQKRNPKQSKRRLNTRIRKGCACCKWWCEELVLSSLYLQLESHIVVGFSCVFMVGRRQEKHGLMIGAPPLQRMLGENNFEVLFQHESFWPVSDKI